MKKLFVVLIGSAISFCSIASEANNKVLTKDNFSYCQGMTSNAHAWCYAEKGSQLTKNTPKIVAVSRSGENKSVWATTSK